VARWWHVPEPEAKGVVFFGSVFTGRLHWVGWHVPELEAKGVVIFRSLLRTRSQTGSGGSDSAR